MKFKNGNYLERKSKDEKKFYAIGIDNWNVKSFVLSIVKLHTLTATTTDLGIGLNGKMVLYLG